MRLADHEIRFAAMVGIERHLRSLGSEERNKVGNAGFGWHTDIEASCAEMAFAKKVNRYWDGSVDTFKLPDVGFVQVRHTERVDGCLVVRPGDLDGDVFALMVGRCPVFRFMGWVRGADAKVTGFERDPGGKAPAWFVPQASLTRTNPFAVCNEGG